MITFNPYIFPHAIAAVILVVLGIYSIRFRNLPMAVPFGLLMFSASIWCIVYLMEIIVTDFNLKVLFCKSRFIGLGPLASLWFAVALYNMGGNIWFKGKRWLILVVVPVIVIVLSMTSSYHNLFRYDYSLIPGDSLGLLKYKNGPFFKLYYIYSYIMAFLSGYLLYRSLRKKGYIRRVQTLLIAAGIIFFIGADQFFQLGITPVPNYNLSPAALSITGIMISVAVFRYRFLDIAPVTRSMVMDSIADSIIVIDTSNNLIEFNRAAIINFSLDPVKSPGIPLSSVHPAFELFYDKENSFKGIYGDTTFSFENSEKIFDVSAEPVLFKKLIVVGTLIHLRDVTERKSMEKKITDANRELQIKIEEIEKLQVELKDQAIRDALTGLYNRRYMDESIERDLHLAVRMKSNVSFVIIDIDFFKAVNDNWGHQAGDAVLRSAAGLMSEIIRRSDMACRFGGEEFLIIMPGALPEFARDLAEQIRAAFEKNPVYYDGNEIRVTLSAGVSAYPVNGNNSADIIGAADRALYMAKKSGRNRVVVYS